MVYRTARTHAVNVCLKFGHLLLQRFLFRFIVILQRKAKTHIERIKFILQVIERDSSTDK